VLLFSETRCSFVWSGTECSFKRHSVVCNCKAIDLQTRVKTARCSAVSHYRMTTRTSYHVSLFIHCLWQYKWRHYNFTTCRISEVPSTCRAAANGSRYSIVFGKWLWPTLKCNILQHCDYIHAVPGRPEKSKLLYHTDAGLDVCRGAFTIDRQTATAIDP